MGLDGAILARIAEVGLQRMGTLFSTAIIEEAVFGIDIVVEVVGNADVKSPTTEVECHIEVSQFLLVDACIGCRFK